MNTKFLIRFALVLALTLAEIAGGAILWPERVAAAQTPFLITPYFGSKRINSIFDHKYPTYGQYPNNSFPNVTKYTGVEHASCYADASGTWCYDGHDGVDFDLRYEHVVAAATGNVVYADWYVRNCRSGSTCWYGLTVKIAHINNTYTTLYGHLSALAVSATGSPQVLAGTVIASSGNTGNSTGKHLHFGVYNSLPRPVDPFGWSGTAGQDPWELYSAGAHSDCLWSDGEWADVCGGIRRVIPEPSNGGEILVHEAAGGFTKGSGGPFNNPCAGAGCPGWPYNGTNPYVQYYTLADGGSTPDHWARWDFTGGSAQAGMYEIYVHVPSTPQVKTWQAKYILKDGSGNVLSNGQVDQGGLPDSTVPGSDWVSIGMSYMTTGYYLYTTDATGEVSGQHCAGYTWCTLLVDAVKFVRRGTVHEPDIVATNGSVNAVMRNNGGGYAQVVISLFDAAGNPQGAYLNTVSPNSTWTFVYPGCNCASGIIDATQDVSVVINKDASTPAASHNGLSPTAGDTQFTVGTTIYTPLSLAHWGSWHTWLSIRNTSAAQAQFYITYYNTSGSATIVGPYYLAPNASGTYDANSHLGFAFAGSAVVSSNQSLALIALESNGAMTGAYDGLTAGATTTYVPLILKGWSSGWTTGVQVQNLEAATANVTLTYYNLNGTVAATQSVSFPPYGSGNVTPNTVSPWSGSAIATSDRAIAIEVDEWNPNTGNLQSYDGLGWATPIAYLPDVRSSSTWGSGLIVQNVSSSSSHMQMQVNGQIIWDSWVEPRGWRPIGAASIPASGQGYIVSLNGAPLVVEVDNYWVTSGDMLTSYTGFNR